MKHDLTVPCFLTGKNVTIRKRDVPVRFYFPRSIPRTTYCWDTENDHILIHWKTIRKFTLTEIAKRTGFSRKTIRDQLQRLNIYEKYQYDTNSVWLVSNDKILHQLWLEGLTGDQLAKYFNVQRKTITLHLKRLGLRKHKR